MIVAVSATGDPTGKYHSYLLSTRYFPDYPKYAIWNNAYYAKTNDFGGCAHAYGPANESKSLLQVVDISGRTVLSNNISGSTYSLNTLSLKAGVYLLKVSNTNMVRYMKFVKE